MGPAPSQQNPDPGPVAGSLAARIRSRSAVIGIVGLGYVGLPLAVCVAAAGYRVCGFDLSAGKVQSLNQGLSYIRHVSAADIRSMRERGQFEATTDLGRLGEPDLILICVPTPLTPQQKPDLSHVVATAQAIARHLRKGQLVVLESTTYPGTTTGLLRPLLEESGLACGHDFFVAYSPEREDPGNNAFNAGSIPKVVAGEDDAALHLASAFYDAIVPRAVPVSSTATAEAVKLTENVFRSVNIALMNELKLVYDAMGIDVWEVIDAAKTKPFGFMPFYPGPGPGGHCIPIDPVYLAWKAREAGVPARLIELAAEVNTLMPRHVVDRVDLALARHAGRGLSGARVLVLGVAYKKNVADLRESPALVIMNMLRDRGAGVEFHDPYIALIPPLAQYGASAGVSSVGLALSGLGAYDAVVVVTDHDAVDYQAVARNARLVIDTRNACANAGVKAPHIIKC